MLKPGEPLPAETITTITGKERLISSVTGCPRLQEMPQLVFIASNIANQRSQIAIGLCDHYQRGSCRADGNRGPCKLDGTGWAYRQGDLIEKTSLRIVEPDETAIRLLHPDVRKAKNIDKATLDALTGQLNTILLPDKKSCSDAQLSAHTAP